MYFFKNCLLNSLLKLCRYLLFKNLELFSQIQLVIIPHLTINTNSWRSLGGIILALQRAFDTLPGDVDVIELDDE